MDNIKIDCIRKHCVIIDNFNIKLKFFDTNSFNLRRKYCHLTNTRNSGFCKGSSERFIKIRGKYRFYIDLYQRTMPVSKMSYPPILALQ